MDMTFLMEPLAGIDAKEDSYSFYDACDKNTKDYDGTARQYFGAETGLFNMFPEFTLDLVRYKTFRNSILDSEDAESAAGFWSTGWMKENVQISCVNLETSGASIKYT